MRLTSKNINEELAKRGFGARLEKGDGYFYFAGGETANWLDRTVKAPNLSSLTLEQWIGEFERLAKLNHDLVGAPSPKPSSKRAAPSAKKKQKKG